MKNLFSVRICPDFPFGLRLPFPFWTFQAQPQAVAVKMNPTTEWMGPPLMGEASGPKAHGRDGMLLPGANLRDHS